MLRFPKCVIRVVPVVFALALAPAALPSDAQATAMFSGSASVSLTVVGIENLTAPGDAVDVEILAGTATTDPFSGDTFPFEYSEGLASTSSSAIHSPAVTPPDFDDPTLLGIGDSLSVSVSGSATADATGYAEVFAAAFGLITIDNYSTTDDVEVSFLLSFSVAAEAGVDDPVLEDAIGGASAGVFSITEGFILDEFAEADGLFGPPVDGFSDSFMFSLFIGADDYDDIEIIVDTDGLAEAIPAPGGLAFLLAGLLLIRFRRS